MPENHLRVEVSPLGADSVDDSDMGVVQRRGGAGLTLEAGQSLWVTGEVLWQHLDGDITIKLRIPRPIHLSHAALTERFNDFVMT